jgi:acyl carrier protein
VDTTEEKVISIVQNIVNDGNRESVVITASSEMGNPRAWDSLLFVEIFEEIGIEFSLDLSDDDAVHFMSIAEIVKFIVVNM